MMTSTEVYVVAGIAQGSLGGWKYSMTWYKYSTARAAGSGRAFAGLGRARWVDLGRLPSIRGLKLN